MSIPPFANLTDLAAHLRQELAFKKFILLYAYNGTGKTRLSTIFKDLGKVSDEPDTLYFNAFTEDLFSWDNDLKEDRERKLKINPESRFITSLWEIEMDTRIRPFLSRYTDFDFRIDTDKWEVIFSRKVPNPNYVENAEPQTEERTKIETHIKISRGEENIFIWCFFLAVVQLAMDGIEAYNWVKYIYIDDPISSLDENNAIAVANHLTQMFMKSDKSRPTVVSTHHPLFFNVLCNELGKKARKYFLKAGEGAGEYVLNDINGQEFLHHLSTLAELNELLKSGVLYTHHFNMLRRVMEQTANFFGMSSWKDCIAPEADDPDKTLYERIINLMSHGDYSVFEAKEMMAENKKLFRRIFDQFIRIHPFNPERFPS
ncbi:MAG: AAA family ATPase [Terrimicrobiaceae bacterium]